MRRGRAALFAVALFYAAAAPAHSMPPFAQAYSADCSVCHTQVPALNAHGRYIQRTGYDALDHKLLKRSLPLWVGVNATYDSQDGSSHPRPQFGNVAVHAVGVTGNWSYHVQQWLVQNNMPGTLDTAWVSYNALLHGSAHLFAGKIETPAPSPFSQWFDLANISGAELTVGEHQYQLDTNRWGARFSYVRGVTDAVAWLGSNGNAGGDKTLQWKLALANPDRPLEISLFGSRGSFALQEGGADQYASVAAYLQRDPSGGVPGVFAIYQRTYDGHPGEGLGAAAGSATLFELYQRFVKGKALIGIRKEMTSDGLGNALQEGNIDVEYHLARFIHVYAESAFAQNSLPRYRYMVWWTTPLERVP